MDKILKCFLFISIAIFCNIELLHSRSEDSKFVFIMSFPDETSEKAGEYLATPYDLVFYKEQYFITDSKENCIKVFSSDGKLLKKIGSRGQGPREFSDPYCITLDEKKGQIYCYDGGNRRISCFSVNGEFIKFIKTSLSIWDMKFHNGNLYSSAYSDANQSHLMIYDEAGNIKKFYGTLFDNKINNLPHTYKQILYGNALLDVNKDNLFLFFEYLPFVQIYDKEGNLEQSIKVNIKEIKKRYKINQNPKRRGSRMGIHSWLFGACVSGDELFCYSPYQLECMLVMNKNGKLTRKIHFDKTVTHDQLIRRRFIKKNGDNFIFIDLGTSKVIIFQEEKSNDSSSLKIDKQNFLYKN